MQRRARRLCVRWSGRHGLGLQDERLAPRCPPGGGGTRLLDPSPRSPSGGNSNARVLSEPADPGGSKESAKAERHFNRARDASLSPSRRPGLDDYKLPAQVRYRPVRRSRRCRGMGRLQGLALARGDPAVRAVRLGSSIGTVAGRLRGSVLSVGATSRRGSAAYTLSRGRLIPFGRVPRSFPKTDGAKNERQDAQDRA